MAAEDWEKFGNRSIPTTSPFTIKLGGLDDLYRRREEKLEEFGKITGDAYDRFMEKRIGAYPAERKAILEKKAAQQSQSERELVKGFYANLTRELEGIARESDS